MKKIVIWGASGHAKVAADAARASRTFDVAGFVDDVNPSRRGEAFEGAEVLGGRECLDGLLAKGVKRLFIAVGDCAARTRLAAQAREKGFQLVSIVHPKATIAAGVSLGAGTLAAAGAIVNPGSRIGECVVVNTCASVDHDCVLEDGCHVGPSACLGGRVHVGRGAWIGIGAVVKDGVSIGDGSVVGAGAVVLKDVPAGVVVYGVPAQVVRKIE